MGLFGSKFAKSTNMNLNFFKFHFVLKPKNFMLSRNPKKLQKTITNEV